MVGHFAFFLADECPVLVFKATRVAQRQGVMGFVGQWWTPSNNKLRLEAATVEFDAYCNTRVTYTPDFVMRHSPPGGRSARAPDLGWERADRVVVWSKSKGLNGKGKKLPKYAVDAVARAFQQRSKERERKRGEAQREEGEPQREGSEEGGPQRGRSEEGGIQGQGSPGEAE